MAILTTSGTYTYSVSVVNLLSASLRLCQVIGESETATGDQLQNGMDAMAAMVKGWQASGIHVWAEEECTLFLQTGQVLYDLGGSSTDHACLTSAYVQTSLTANAAASATTITVDSITGISNGNFIGIQLDDSTNFWTTVSGAPSGSTVTLASALTGAASDGAFVFSYGTPLMRPLRVYGGRRYNFQPVSGTGAIETPILMMARLDYQALPNKYTSGIVTQFFYDPQQGEGAYTSPTGQMNVWPSPSNNQFSMRFTAQRPLQDIASLANIPDFPVEWNAALKWNLALELVPEYGVPNEQAQVIKEQAAKWYGLASSWDRESESLLFGVAMAPGYRRG